jgi:hypothetical protein
MKDFGKKYNCKVELTTFHMDEAMANVGHQHGRAAIVASRPQGCAGRGGGTKIPIDSPVRV